MSLLSRTRPALAVGLSVAAVFLLAGGASAQNKFKKDTVTFRTVDSVELKGTLWTPDKATKNACVLLLHNFSKQKGGDRSDEGWVGLGEDLAKEGYTVLSFDFRGHGDSKTVGKDFWNVMKFPQNNLALKKGGPALKELPTAIDYKDFQTTPSTYYLHLVDDIAAAKAFLDNKAGGAAGNTIVIGAGHGATLGAMWMASEWHRYRDKSAEDPMAIVGRPNLDADPEGKDIACAVWLTMSGNVDTHQVPAVTTWLEDVGGKKNKVPMLFLYGADDADGKRKAGTALARIMPGYKLMESAEGLNKFEPALKLTRDYAIEGTKLDGSQLLQKSLSTNAVIKGYLDKVMEERGNKETKRHEQEKFRYFWVFNRQVTPAKKAGEEFMMPINPMNLGVVR
jgi:pimeloyl-ACP methyl ester carboxylesterase